LSGTPSSPRSKSTGGGAVVVVVVDVVVVNVVVVDVVVVVAVDECVVEPTSTVTGAVSAPAARTSLDPVPHDTATSAKKTKTA
jgi:hypothetical protein